jgi:hypothetical protein
MPSPRRAPGRFAGESSAFVGDRQKIIGPFVAGGVSTFTSTHARSAPSRQRSPATIARAADRSVASSATLFCRAHCHIAQRYQLTEGIHPLPDRSLGHRRLEPRGRGCDGSLEEVSDFSSGRGPALPFTSIPNGRPGAYRYALRTIRYSQPEPGTSSRQRPRKRSISTLPLHRKIGYP